MNWNEYFDKIYLINLPERTDRLKEATEELGKYDIPFEVFPGIKCDIGQEGIYLTLISLIQQCFEEDLKNVLIFEDDILFLNNPVEYFTKPSGMLPKHTWEYDIFYLGLNTDEKLLYKNTKIVYNGIYQSSCVVKHAYGCHAMCFSRDGMIKFLTSAREKCVLDLKYYEPVDVMISKEIISKGNCYCSYPMLATQRDSYSDIEKKVVDNSYIEKRFIESTKHLFK